MKKTSAAKKIRNQQRRSSPIAIVQEMQLPELSKSLQDGSFQAVYQRITKEMRINIIPSRRRERHTTQQTNINYQRQRTNTEQVEEVRNTQVYYSVERSRNSQIVPMKNILPKKPQITNRRTKSTAKFVNRMRISQSVPSGKLQLQEPLRELIVSEIELNQDFIYIADVVYHFKRFDNILGQLRQFTSLESIITSIREYILDDDDSTISQFHTLFTSEQYRRQAKQFLFYERVCVLVVVDELVRNKIQFQLSQLRHTLTLIHETYVDIIITVHKAQPAFLLDSNCLQWIENMAGNHTRSVCSLFRHNESIHRKVNNILRHTKDFLHFIEAEKQSIAHLGSNMVFYRLLEFYSLHLASVMPISNSLVGFLATCPSPYLHHSPMKEYTLVLDLDETLVHYNFKNSLSQLKVRPFCQEFIFEMSEFFEVGVFTCGMQDYADWATNHLRGIQFKLYRHHAVQTSTGFIKDLSRLGRDIKRTIILDNLSHNFQLQKQNGIEIASWFGDLKDTALLEAMELLKFVVSEQPEDVRERLKLAAERLSSSNNLKYHN